MVYDLFSQRNNAVLLKSKAKKKYSEYEYYLNCVSVTASRLYKIRYNTASAFDAISPRAHFFNIGQDIRFKNIQYQLYIFCFSNKSYFELVLAEVYVEENIVVLIGVQK